MDIELQKIKDWTTHFNLSDKNHNLADGKRFEFLPKEKFQDPTDLFNSLLRGADEALQIKPFKLHFVGLKPRD